MCDDLMENDPEMRRLREKWRDEGRAKAFAEKYADEFVKGQVQGACIAILILVKAWFPTLEELAQQKIARMRSPKNLLRLFKQLLSASDEETARTLLTKNK